MSDDSLIQRLMVTFLGELEDHVRALERDLLALEKDLTPAVRSELFKTLFRTAHSLKGAARSVRVSLVETAGHRLEEIFAAARDGRLAVDAGFFGLLLPAVDAIGEAARRLRAGKDLSGAPLEVIVRRLGAVIASRTDTAAAEPRATPAPAEPERWSGVVRVPAEKLDRLLTRSGELLAVRHRAEARREEAAVLQDTLGEFRKNWRRIEHDVAVLLKRGNGRDPGPAVNEAVRSLAGLKRQVAQALDRNNEDLHRFERGLQQLAGNLRADRRVIEQTATPLDAEVRRTRMLPFAEACEGLERMVRDLTAGSDKDAVVVIVGGEIELDRSVLEGLKDPLLHIVRNAVDHGIESVAARRAAGKPDAGRVTVTAAIRGARVEVAIADDGRGLDLAAIREQLRKMDLPAPESERDLARQIFLPGFSTSPEVTRLSGRGVGLDVVKTRLESMRGTVDVSFEPGKQTQFTLSVPLTLTSIRAILAVAGGQVFAIDTQSVHRILRIGAENIQLIEGREVLLLDGFPVPVVALTERLGMPGRPEPADGGKTPAVVLASGNRLAAFVVGEFLGEREVMVRALGPRLRNVKNVTGGMVLADGGIALILNAADLVSGVHNLGATTGVAQSMTAAPRSVRKRLLVVDDSVAVRTLEKSILEAAGYDVMVAADGAEAWQILLEQGADLVVTDIEMPRMDGFSLTEAIRGSKRFRNLPVILMTARESDSDKTRGMAAGADAYRIKSAFDQTDLLATIEQVL
jgi:two-component system chemotaxis sensor kinase CheA